MTTALNIALLIAGGYLLGSVPFGLLVARYVGGIDIRQLGSGNIGATNVGRAMGVRWFFVVMALDALKGALPVWSTMYVLGTETGLIRHVQVLVGLAAVLGHMFPCWLNFKGGKGVATGLGVILVIGPKASAAAAIAFILTLAMYRMISLSSIIAAVVFCVVQLWQLLSAPVSAATWPLAAFAVVIPLLIIVQHRSNIRRILAGTERKVGDKRPDPAATQAAAEPAPAREQSSDRTAGDETNPESMY